MVSVGFKSLTVFSHSLRSGQYPLPLSSFWPCRSLHRDGGAFCFDLFYEHAA